MLVAETTTIQLDISQVSIRPDGILQIDILPETIVSENDIMQVIKAAETLGRGKRFLNVIRMGNFSVPDDHARSLMASDRGSQFKLADAFVMPTLAQQIVAKFYIGYHKPVVPTQYFNSEEAAVRWLHSLS